MLDEVKFCYLDKHMPIFALYIVALSAYELFAHFLMTKGFELVTIFATFTLNIQTKRFERKCVLFKFVDHFKWFGIWLHYLCACRIKEEVTVMVMIRHHLKFRPYIKIIHFPVEKIMFYTWSLITSIKYF